MNEPLNIDKNKQYSIQGKVYKFVRSNYSVNLRKYVYFFSMLTGSWNCTLTEQELYKFQVL